MPCHLMAVETVNGLNPSTHTDMHPIDIHPVQRSAVEAINTIKLQVQHNSKPYTLKIKPYHYKNYTFSNKFKLYTTDICLSTHCL